MQPVYANTDLVPFRLTPNMQKFLGPIFTEGILVPGLMAMGRALTEPEVSAPVLFDSLFFLIAISTSLSSSSVC